MLGLDSKSKKNREIALGMSKAVINAKPTIHLSDSIPASLKLRSIHYFE
jgi:hypothetical protein